MKGTGFSPYLNALQMNSALAAEGWIATAMLKGVSSVPKESE
jgi:hypothetical protein